MKKLLVLISLVLFVNFGYSQNELYETKNKGDNFKINVLSDTLSLEEKFLILEYKNQKAGYELTRHYKQHMNGVYCSLSGVGVSILGVFIVTDNSKLTIEPMGKTNLGIGLIIIGSGLSLAGIITTIDANRHIKQAGLDLQLSPTEFKLKYKF